MAKKRIQRKLLKPGIQFVGQQFIENPEIQLFLYSSGQIKEYSSIGDFDKVAKHLSDKTDQVSWLNVHGLHDVSLIHKIADYFSLDKLVVQDIVDTTQRPKIETHPKYLFFTIKSFLPSREKSLESEQISFILFEGILISFQEKRGDHFEHIRHRLREKTGQVRHQKADFLLYLLIDAIAGNYFTTLAEIEVRLDGLPAEVTRDPRPELISIIEEVKSNLFTLRKSVFPLKEAVFFSEKIQETYISSGVTRYFSDLKDQLLLLFDETEINLSRIEGVTNLFFSYQGHRMNEVMKVLTLVATLFIPITFIAGIYGMNFTNMPELNWKWGYPAVWVIILGSITGMLLFFKRKRWF